MPQGSIGKAALILSTNSIQLQAGLKRAKQDVGQFFGSFGMATSMPFNKLFQDSKTGYSVGQTLGKQLGSGIGSMLGASGLGGAIGGPIGAAVGVAVGAAVGLLEHAISSTFGFIEKFKELNKVAREFQTNVTVMSAFGYAASRSGTDVETAEHGLKHFVKELDDLRAGLPDAKAKFAALGLSASSFANQGNIEAFITFAEAISQGGKNARITGQAMGFFGERYGARMTYLLQQGYKLRDLMKEGIASGNVITPQEAARLQQAATAMNLMKLSMESLGKESATTLGPYIAAIALANAHVMRNVREWVHGKDKVGVDILKEAAQDAKMAQDRLDGELRKKAMSFAEDHTAARMFDERMKGLNLLRNGENKDILSGAAFEIAVSKAAKEFVHATGANKVELATGAEQGSKELISAINHERTKPNLAEQLRTAEAEAARQRAAQIENGKAIIELLKQKGGGKFNPL